MVDFDIQRCSRRCAKSDQEFAPGDVFYSVLIAQGSDVVRYDYGQAAWEGPPNEAIGWWRSEMPEPTARRANWAPNDVMLDYFQQLETQAGKQDVRYILTLLMIRRRVLRLEDSEFDDQGHERMVVFCPRNDTEYHVPVVSPDAARAREIQDELARLLLSDAV